MRIQNNHSSFFNVGLLDTDFDDGAGENEVIAALDGALIVGDPHQRVEVIRTRGDCQ